jgi:uncharacterized iron-regulated protein
VAIVISKIPRLGVWGLGVALLAAAAPLCAGDDILRLPIGDPERRGKDVAVVLDGITDTSSGEVIGPAMLPNALAGVRVLFVGESHTDMETHRIELRVIEELARAGRKVFVGLEMYPYTEQKFLDQWSAGELPEAAFLEASRWYKNWGYHWNYYRDIFLFAQRNRMRMFAINTPREVVATVRKKGFVGLTDEERAHIPPKVETDNPEHLRLFKASFESDSFHAGMNEEDWKAMDNAQCVWDATMGWNAVSALQKFGDEKTIMVVLIGSGHVQYGLGAERQVKGSFSGKIASLLPVPAFDEKKGRVDAVNGAYANFVWGIPAETDPLYPSIGLATRVSEADQLLSVLDAEKGSPAARAGVAAKDLLVTFDGALVKDKETLARLVAGKSWGDTAKLVVRRAGQDIALTVFFRREPRVPATPAPSASRATP